MLRFTEAARLVEDHTKICERGQKQAQIFQDRGQHVSHNNGSEDNASWIKVELV